MKTKNNIFNDFDKFLITSTQVYLFVLVIIFIIKLIGLNYFGLDVNNPIILKINNIVWHFKIREIWYIFTLWLYAYIMLSIVCNNKKVKIKALILTLVNVICILTIKYQLSKFFRFLLDIGIVYIGCLIFNKKCRIKETLKRSTICIFGNILFQFISIITRKGNLVIDQKDFISFFILNLDYILLMLISYKIYFMKGGIKLCGMVEVGLSSLKKMNLKNLLKKLQTNYSNFKKQDKKYKTAMIIYFIMSFIWNVLNILLILFIAILNNTLIECIFILTAFFITKRVFGKAFHLDSMIKCFVVSNLTYYILNRITTPIGISIFVPIILGVGLSYITSKLVKKTYKPLYKGMNKELFNETILQLEDEGSINYNICYDYFIKRQNAIILARKYNYTQDGIRKKISRINKKIKELNI